MTTEREQILALAGEPVANVTNTDINSITWNPSYYVANLGEPLYTADQILAATKPLEEENERNQLDNASLAQQLAEKSKQADYWERNANEAVADLKKQLAAANAAIERLEAQVQSQALDCLSADGQALDSWTQLAASQLLIESLWAIIDDIDTYGDMAKSDDKVFRAMVERRQKDRWKTGITTDGYTLALPSDTTALEAMIQKAGEVMRERALVRPHPPWANYLADGFIRTLPPVKLEDLK